jgi:hypothetical protein
MRIEPVEQLIKFGAGKIIKDEHGQQEYNKRNNSHN